MPPPSSIPWHLGTIGFTYPEWAGTFYPAATSDADRLAYLATRMNAVEINTTFYQVPAPDNLRRWADATPADFRFALKMPRDVTHGFFTTPVALPGTAPTPQGHLLAPAVLDTARRLADAALALGPKLSAILLQFPAVFTADRFDELAAFLPQLPAGPRYAIEFRHESWWTPATAALLRAHALAWVATDESPQRHAAQAPADRLANSPGTLPIVPTSDLLYLRFLGKHGQFPHRRAEHLDPAPRLAWWADRVRKVLAASPKIREAIAFFDNDFAGHAPTTLPKFARALGLPGFPAPEPPREEPSLFNM